MTHKILWNLLKYPTAFIVIVSIMYWPIHAIQNPVQAEELTFGLTVPEDFKIDLPNPSHWQLPGAPEYKNERLGYYQSLLVERGITDRQDLRLFAAQLLQENGAIAEDRHGDGGCSIGIPQRNVCQFGYSAKSFIRKYPEWKDWRMQMRWMADYTAKQYERFDKNAKCTIIYHNRPASALAGCRDTAAGYYKTISAKASLLSSL